MRGRKKADKRAGFQLKGEGQVKELRTHTMRINNTWRNFQVVTEVM